MRTIWLARHGYREDFANPTWHETAERPYDTPLSKDGRTMALDTGAFLADRSIEAIYTSPFLRAIETAGLIASRVDVPIYIEHGLCELLHEEWFPGQPAYVSPFEMQKHYPQIATDYCSRVTPSYPEDEAAGDVDRRCLATIEAIMKESWRTTLWVGHAASVGGLARSLMGHCEGVCFEMCGLTELVNQGDGWRVASSGTNHLSITEAELSA